MRYKCITEAQAEVPRAGGVPPAFFISGDAMRELSIFVDEAGQQDTSDGYYLLTLVAHDQSVPIHPTVLMRG